MEHSVSSSADGTLIRFLNPSVGVTVVLRHIELADAGVVVNEDVSFRFDISDSSTLWDIASFGELPSGEALRPWITFHMLGPSELDIASWRRIFQLSVLAGCYSVAAFASLVYVSVGIM